MAISALPRGPRRPPGDFRGNGHCGAMNPAQEGNEMEPRRPPPMAQAPRPEPLFAGWFFWDWTSSPRT
jgi:hypothetical protein